MADNEKGGAAVTPAPVAAKPAAKSSEGPASAPLRPPAARGTLPSPLDPTAKVKAIAEDRRPDAVQFAAKVRADAGAGFVAFYVGKGANAKRVSVDAIFEPVGSAGTTVRTTDTVWEEHVIAKTTTPIRRLLFPAGALVPVAQAHAIREAASQAQKGN